jgi:CSLREA domain-containing protein
LVGLIAGVFVLLALLPVMPAQAGTAWGCHYEDNNPAPVCDYPPKPACTEIGATPPTFTPATEGCKFVQRAGSVSVTWGLPIPYDYCIRSGDGFTITNMPCFDWSLGAGVGAPTGGVYSVAQIDRPYIGSPNGSCFLTSKNTSPGYYAAQCDFGLLHPETPIDITVELDVNLYGVPGKTLYTGWYSIHTYQPTKPNAVITYSQNKNVFHFSGTGSSVTSPLAEIKGWSWTIDGVNAGSTAEIDKTFSTPGKHKVELTVTDSKGVTSDVATIFVDPSTAPGIKVNSTGDAPASKPADGCYTGNTISGGDPECTLRAAIQALNAGFADTITFAITGGNATIAPGSALPKITRANATIDGTTQSNGRVAIDKESLFVDHVGGVTIKGLNFTSSSSYGVVLVDGLNAKITGNKFGVAPDGTAKLGDGAVEVVGSTGATVGGTGADANVIAATKSAMLVAASDTHDSDNVTIKNNFVGVNETGTPLGKGNFGILAVSGLPASAKNLTISGNVIAGFGSNVVVAGDAMEGAKITGNLVGVDPGATKTIGDPTHNIRVDGVPKASITNNTVSGAFYDILDAGSLQLSLDSLPNGDGFTVQLNTPLSAAFDRPKWGTANNISGNHVGLIGINSGAHDGIRVWEAADAATVVDNTVAGHIENEIRINAAKDHKVTDNLVGIGAPTGAPKAPNGISLDNTDAVAVEGNIVGNVQTAFGLKAATKTTLTGNTAGLEKDGATKAAVITGIWVDVSSRAAQVGPGNAIANATNAGIAIDAKDTTVTGNKIGVPAFGAGTAGNKVGIAIAPDLEDIVIGSSTGKNVIANNQTGIATAGKDVKIASNTFGIVTSGAQGNGTAIDVTAGSASIQDNVIANSTKEGVHVGEAKATIRSNSIYNTVSTKGITDAPKAPKIDGAARITHGTSVRTWLVVKDLPTTGTGTIEVFGNPSCADPEGKTPLFTKTPISGQSTRVISIIGRPTLHGITVTYTDADGKTSVFSACAEPKVMPDTDGDGIPDIVEDAAPVPTGAAPYNASFVTDNDQWVTVLAPAGAQLTNVAPIDDPNPSGHVGASFPFGFLDFKVTGVKAGEITKIGIAVAGGTKVESWYKYGPKTRGGASTFWGFGFDKQTLTGATVSVADLPGYGLSTVVTLNIEDGGRGDEDFLANGTIVDPGGLSAAAAPVDNTGTTTTTTTTTPTTTVPTAGTTVPATGSGTNSSASNDTSTGGTLPFTGSSPTLAWIAFWSLLAGALALTVARKFVVRR